VDEMTAKGVKKDNQRSGERGGQKRKKKKWKGDKGKKKGWQKKSNCGEGRTIRRI